MDDFSKMFCPSVFFFFFFFFLIALTYHCTQNDQQICSSFSWTQSTSQKYRVSQKKKEEKKRKEKKRKEKKKGEKKKKEMQ